MEILLLILGIILFIIVISIISSYFRKQKCPNCKKRHCVEEKREEISRQKVMFEEKEIIKHVDNKRGLYGGAATSYAELKSQYGKPDSTTIRKYKVPGERIYYKVTFKCNDCGNIFTTNGYVDNKVPTVRG